MVLGAVLAITASVGYGVSDVLSGSAVRRYSTAAVALWSQLVGLALLAWPRWSCGRPWPGRPSAGA